MEIFQVKMSDDDQGETENNLYDMKNEVVIFLCLRFSRFVSMHHKHKYAPAQKKKQTNDAKPHG